MSVTVSPGIKSVFGGSRVTFYDQRPSRCGPRIVMIYLVSVWRHMLETTSCFESHGTWTVLFLSVLVPCLHLHPWVYGRSGHRANFEASHRRLHEIIVPKNERISCTVEDKISCSSRDCLIRLVIRFNKLPWVSIASILLLLFFYV